MRWCFVVTAVDRYTNIPRWRRFMHRQSAEEYAVLLESAGFARVTLTAQRVKINQPMGCKGVGIYPRKSTCP